MKNWKRLKALPVYIAMATIVSACGAGTATLQNSAGASSSANNSNNPYTFPTPVPSSTVTALGSALQYDIANTGISGALGTCKDCLTGQGGNYPVYSTFSSSGGYISTDNLLQVAVTAQSGGLLSATGMPGVPSSYSGFSATYDCASFLVSVYDNNGDLLGSQQTGMLAVPGSQGCFNQYTNSSPPSGIQNYTQVLDFSGNLGGPHGGLDIRVTALNYDFYCKMLYDYLGALAPESEYYSYWCPNKIVYRNHSVSAQLQVEVNGTTF